MANLENAIAIAVEAHRGQTEKSGGPYILHPLRAMFRLESAVDRIVAVLHDVVEDTLITPEDLRQRGFSDEVLAALDCVTKREGEDYRSFVARAATNPIARRVKLADLEDNMDVRRLPALTAKDAERLTRYVDAWHTLRSGTRV
jgi:(p)ppGpp synthase/HD superfamily hydrolase